VAVRITVEAEAFVIGGPPARGLVRFADGTQLPLAEVVSSPICTKAGGCTCPSGSPGASHQWIRASTGPVLPGISGHTDGVELLRIVGHDVASACSHEPGDFQPEGPCWCPPGPLGGRAGAWLAVARLEPPQAPVVAQARRPRRRRAQRYGWARS
jgi:hypothetical protein